MLEQDIKTVIIPSGQVVDKRQENRARAIRLAEQIETILRSEPDRSIASEAHTMARSFFYQK